MTPKALIAICATLVALVATAGTAHWLDTRHAPRKPPYPKATPPPPPSEIFEPSADPVLNEAQIDALERDHNALLERHIERALDTRDPQAREAAFTFLLPELLQVEPQRVVVLLERQEPGEARAVLLREIARQWINMDRVAALRWMDSLQDERERHAVAAAAIDSLAVFAPDEALRVADSFDLGRESIDRMRRLRGDGAREPPAAAFP